MIDASLGRAGCCGFPAGQPQMPAPGLPLPPFPPAGAEEPSALNIQLATAQTGIANGAVIPMGAAVRQYGDGLSYDAANHAVIVNRPGVYAFTWQLRVSAAGGGQPVTDAVISLQSLDGSAVLAQSGAPVGEGESVLITGSAAARLRPGTAWALVNNSGGAVSLAVAGSAPAAFAASETVAAVSGAQIM